MFQRVMRRPIESLLVLVVLTSCLPATGCGDDKPTQGTQAAPVNPDEAKAQNEAMQKAMQSKMKTAPKK